MRYTSLYETADGESHFKDLEIEFTAGDYIESAPPVDSSGITSVEHLSFMRVPPGWSSEWHPSAARAMFFVLTGEWEVTASDGETRRFARGSALLAEDLTGKGHRSRVISECDSVAAVVRLE